MLVQVEDTEGHRHLVNLALLEHISQLKNGDAEIHLRDGVIVIDQREWDHIVRMSTKHNQNAGAYK
jgi:hypothetical protein